MKLRQLFDVIVGKVERGEARQTGQLLHLESSGGGMVKGQTVISEVHQIR